MCVKTATISGLANTSSVDANTNITCTADVNAYPPASYIWTNQVDNSQSAGPQFVLQTDTQYKLTCTASNNFNRCNAATDYVEFNSKLTLITKRQLHHRRRSHEGPQVRTFTIIWLRGSSMAWTLTIIWLHYRISSH